MSKVYRSKRAHVARCGFEWGPMDVMRGMDTGRHKVLMVRTDHHEIMVYVSPTGRSVRVFEGNKELKPCPAT